MKATTVIVSALAGLVAAAPTTSEKRGSFDFSQFSNGLNSFDNVNFNYLFSLNQNNLDLILLQQLIGNNNLNIGGFESLFQSNSGFDINSLLQFQQLATLLAIGQSGALNAFDLSGLNFNSLNFGLIDNLNGLDLNQFIQSSLVPQIQTIAQQVVTVVAKE